MRQTDQGHVFTHGLLALSHLMAHRCGVHPRQSDAQEDASLLFNHVRHQVGTKGCHERVVHGLAGPQLVELGDQLVSTGVVARHMACQISRSRDCSNGWKEDFFLHLRVQAQSAANLVHARRPARREC